MVLKTFNLDETTYNRFSQFCKEHGLSMSRQINFFINAQIAETKQIRESYLKKLAKIRKGKYHHFTSFEEFEKAVS